MSQPEIIQGILAKMNALASIAKASFTSTATSPIVIDLQSVGVKTYGAVYWKDLIAEAAKQSWTIAEGSMLAEIEAQNVT